ncbi:winged helix DNA-binding domain-containing protein [Streptomyces mayteni]
MRISARALNRATLGRQMLLGRAPLGAVEGVRRAVALQAQHPASPYLALWNRLADFDAGELDGAFADRAIVKSNMVRMTLHAVHAADYRAFREATEPSLRAAKLGGRFLEGGFTVRDAAALVPRLLDFVREPRTAGECRAWLTEHLGSDEADAWWGLRQYAPLWRVPTVEEVWSFGVQPSYVAPAVPPVLSDAVAATALPTLILRYLEGFGPATVADMARFALVQRARTRAAVRELAGRLERLEGPGGEELFDIPGAPRPAEDTPAPPRLMAMWDSILLAYEDRGRVIPPAYRKLVIRQNGDVLPTLLVDGHVAGVWRAVDGGIEATAFHALPEEVWAGLAAEARRLVAFLGGREPSVYRRYHHWWTRLPAGEARVLPA